MGGLWSMYVGCFEALTECLFARDGSSHYIIHRIDYIITYRVNPAEPGTGKQFWSKFSMTMTINTNPSYHVPR